MTPASSARSKPSYKRDLQVFWQGDCVVLNSCINTSLHVVHRKSPLACCSLMSSWVYVLPTAKETRQQYKQEGNVSHWSRSTEKKRFDPFLYRDCAHTDRQTRLLTVRLPPFPTAIQQRIENKMTRVPEKHLGLNFCHLLKLLFLQTFASLVYSFPEIPGKRLPDTVGMNFSPGSTRSYGTPVHPQAPGELGVSLEAPRVATERHKTL